MTESIGDNPVAYLDLEHSKQLSREISVKPVKTEEVARRVSAMNIELDPLLLSFLWRIET